MAITLGVSATQRDARTTFLVDVTLSLHAPTTPLTLSSVEFSTKGMAGPWSAATPQTYDRRHTAVASLGPIPAAPPDKAFDFVWNAFFDLPPADYPSVLVRATVTDGMAPVTVASPAFALSTVAPAVADPLAARLARQAAISRVPLDFLGDGLLLPFARGSRDFASGVGVDLVRSCVRQILLTRAAVGNFMGDLPWRPDFGCKIWVLRHRNNDDALKALAEVYVREALLWEPRVQVTGVEVAREPNAPPGELKVLVRYLVIERNVPGNRVLLPNDQVTVTLAA